MSLLVDTCAISEFASASPNPKVEAWFSVQLPDTLFLSVLTLGEIEKGLALLDPGRKQKALAAWLGELRAVYATRILPIDEPIAATWGRITADLRRRGRMLKTVDGLIAATALSRRLSIVTRNVADFEGTGARLIDPWAD